MAEMRHKAGCGPPPKVMRRGGGAAATGGGKGGKGGGGDGGNEDDEAEPEDDDDDGGGDGGDDGDVNDGSSAEETCDEDEFVVEDILDQRVNTRTACASLLLCLSCLPGGFHPFRWLSPSKFCPRGS